MGLGFLKFLPEQASAMAWEVDALYLFLVTVSAFFSVLIAVAIVVFAIRYRRRSEDETTPDIHGSNLLEIVWTVIPLGLVLIMFFWGVDLYFRMSHPPANAMEIYATGKQWMWKFQHPEGQREINELHVPIGQPVKIIMRSQDVIHSLFVPAFRVKKDVLPNRYTSLWFEATKPGKYHLFCAEYCGTAHSAMGGHVIAMEPGDYEEWLAGAPRVESVAAAGQKLFQDLACPNCHRAGSPLAPVLDGLYGKQVQLKSGQVVVANEDYLRESIMNPMAKVVEGYPPVMPTFQGRVSEEEVLQLIAYIKSLGGESKEAAAAAH